MAATSHTVVRGVGQALGKATAREKTFKTVTAGPKLNWLTWRTGFAARCRPPRFSQPWRHALQLSFETFDLHIRHGIEAFASYPPTNFALSSLVRVLVLANDPPGHVQYQFRRHPSHLAASMSHCLWRVRILRQLATQGTQINFG